MLVDIIVLLVLILINGFFSCSELAVISVNTTKAKINADKGDKKAKLLLSTLEDADSFLSTIQIAISMVGLFMGAYAGQTFADPVIRLLLSVGINAPRNVVVLLITVLLSYFTLVIGELVPKRLALQLPEKIAYIVIGPITFLSKMCLPFVKLLSFSTNIVVSLLGLKVNEKNDIVTEEEIRALAGVSAKAGNIDETEIKMINNIFEFDDSTADDICTHRLDMVALDIDAPLEEIIEFVKSTEYSKIPVFDNNLDNIIGILHTRDFLKHLIGKKGKFDESDRVFLKGLLEKVYFVPTSKHSDELFTDMKSQKISLSVVVDEYGGTVGLVTMEDLIEEIMGDIFFYDESEDILSIGEGVYEIQGTALLEDVEQALGVGFPSEDYDTINGFLINEIGKIPDANEKPEIEYENILFKVKKSDGKKITSVLVYCNEEK